MSSGEIIRCSIRASNVDQVLVGYLEAADGAIGTVVTLRVVHADHLDLTSAEIEEQFEVVESSADATWCTLRLGVPNTSMMRFPRHRYITNYCRWVFKGTECGYTGEETECGRTFTDCIERNNTRRYGGFPSIPGEGIYLNVSR